MHALLASEENKAPVALTTAILDVLSKHPESLLDTHSLSYFRLEAEITSSRDFATEPPSFSVKEKPEFRISDFSVP
jgi:hypothetical protein